MKIDGKLEEDIWKKGKIFSNFKLVSADTPADVQTKVIFNYDQDNLYFGFICDEPEIEKLKDNVKENSLKVYGVDSVEIMLDADNNKADYYHFLFNSSGYYGVKLRTQSGFVGSGIKNFKLYTGASKEKDKWILEIVIPYASLITERPKETISLNFARNRRIDMVNREESTIAEKGQFHNPFVFVPVKLENIDLSIYQVKVDSLKVEKTYMKNWKIEGLIGTNIENLTEKEKEYLVSIYEEKLGVLDTLKFKLPAQKDKKVDFKCIFPEAKEYEIGMIIKDGDKIVYDAVFPINISYTPVAIEILKPIYRNSIYSSQRLKDIKLKVDIGLKEEEVKNAKGNLLILDEKNEKIVDSEFRPEKENIISLRIPELKVGTYKVVVRLNEEGKTILEGSQHFYKLPQPKGNEVYFDENLNLVVNGKPMLPIIWWSGSPFEEIAKTGADGIIVGFGSGAKKHLDDLLKINQFGVVVLMGGGEEKRYIYEKEKLTEEAIKVITDRINAIKDHPALLFYYLTDEPEGKAVSVTVLKEVYELIKKLDPYHPINITNDSVGGIHTYIDCADMFFPDPYVDPLVDGKLTREMSYISYFMDEIKKAGRGKKFLGVTPQVFDAGKVFALAPPYTTRNNRAPSFVEERCMNYLAIVHGAKGFNYYVYGKRDPSHWGAVNYPDLRVGMPYLIKEIKSLSDVILLGVEKNKDVEIKNKKIHWLVKEYKGKKYVFAVNTSSEDIEVEIAFSAHAVKVISEKRQIEIIEGKFKDRFLPYQVHIYTDNLDSKDVIDLEKVKEEIKKEGGWYIYQAKT